MQRILVLQHMACQNAGIFRDFGASHNIEFIEIDLHAGDAIPGLDQFDGLWVMGGSMNAWETGEHPWLIDEIKIIADVITNDTMPFLGICLGHQLAAVAMGGEVAVSERHEVGLQQIIATNAGKTHALMQRLPDPTLWMNFHLVEVTRLPPGATVLAESVDCENHIIQLGQRAFSCQFHPEVCDHTVAGWMEIPGIPEKLEELVGKEGARQFHRDIAENLDDHNKAARQLFKNWLAIAYNRGLNPRT